MLILQSNNLYLNVSVNLVLLSGTNQLISKLFIVLGNYQYYL